MTKASTGSSTGSTTSTLRAFHGDKKIKARYLGRVRAHRKADELVKGQYWQDGKGCAVGCTIHSGNHKAYETELGIPVVLAKLEDGIFEALDNGHAQEWPERFLSAIRPGADLSKVWPRFAVWLMTGEQWGVIQWAKSDMAKKAIHDVSDAYQKVVDGAEMGSIDWRTLRSAAYAYAADAAVADAAAAAAYAAAKRKEARIAQSDKLIELLKEAA
jgi:hypothetical protein